MMAVSWPVASARRDTGMQAGDELVILSIAFTGDRGLQRRPEVGGSVGVEAGRHDADDGEGGSAEIDGATEGGGISVEEALPGGIAEYRQGWAAGNVFARLELATEERFDAEDVKESGTDALLLDIGGAAIGVEIDASVVAVDCWCEQSGVVANELPGAAVLADIDARESITRNMPSDHDETVRVGVGERPEEECVDHAVDGGVGSNAEAERNEDCEGEGRAFAQQAESETEIA